jgi:hypothetical protein
MKRPWLIVALLLSVGINIGVLATIGLARARGGPRSLDRSDRPPIDRPDGPPVERLASRMGLEGESRERFVSLQREFFASFVAMKREHDEIHHQLRREVGDDVPDEERIDGLLERSARLNAQMERAFIENVVEVREILEPEQEAIYFRVLEQMRRGGGGPRGPGERGGRRRN